MSIVGIQKNVAIWFFNTKRIRAFDVYIPFL